MNTIETVRVRFVRPYQAYRAGQVVEVTGGLARSLELQCYAVRHAEPQLEFAAEPEPASLERAEAPVSKKRRKRNA
jgi:hypothetical protein